jgi:tryptophan-rich sensory protein
MEEATRSYGRAAHAAMAIGVVFAASFIGNAATMPNIPTWYAEIQKPWFTPPNWLFGPVWTLLFTGLIVAFYRILRLDPQTPGRGRAIIIFIAQIACNALWSIAFFGMRSPGLGLVVIVFLWSSIVANMIAFRRLDRLSSWIFPPYLAWVTFAGALNLAIFMMN